MLDAIIIGAGMAGLGAALELKENHLGYVILEAMPHAGGRASSIRTPSGTMVDLGAHWLHGAHNPLKLLLDNYGIAYEKDKNRHLRIYKNGEMREEHGIKWLERCIDRHKAEQIKTKQISDMPLSALAVDEESRQMLKDFAYMWNGLEPPLEPSALEFLTDESTPGGFLLEQGVGELFMHLQKDVGLHHIRFNTPVHSIRSTGEGVEVKTGGETLNARKAFFTGSMMVIKNGLVTFEPTIKEDFSLFAMGMLNKIIIELSEDFFASKAIPDNLALELLDGKKPHFCHVSKPLITLFAAGDAAGEVEKMTAAQAIAYVKKAVAPVEELQGFEASIVGDPIVTQWVGNPYTQGSYSACLPGGARSWPVAHGNIYLCGDTFDPHYFSSLAGAYRSGQVAARLFARPEEASIPAGAFLLPTL